LEGGLANNKILSPEPPNLEITDVGQRQGRGLQPSVAMCLILAFRPDRNMNSLGDKALAMLTCRKIALVPVSAQKGDLVILLSAKGHSKEFVF
jgi:hypothetical protein